MPSPKTDAVQREVNRVGFLVDNDTLIPSTVLERVIHPRVGKWTVLNSGTSGYKNQKTLSMYVSNGKALGIPKNQTQASPDYSFPTDLVTYPIMQWFVHIWTKDLIEGNGSHVVVDYKITYYCKFYEPKDDAFNPGEPPGTFDLQTTMDIPQIALKTRPDPPEALVPDPDDIIS